MKSHGPSIGFEVTLTHVGCSDGVSINGFYDSNRTTKWAHIHIPCPLLTCKMPHLSLHTAATSNHLRHQSSLRDVVQRSRRFLVGFSSVSLLQDAISSKYATCPQYIVQSTLADVSLFGLWRLFDNRILVFLNLACFRSFLRATMTGTEDFVTR